MSLSLSQLDVKVEPLAPAQAGAFQPTLTLARHPWPGASLDGALEALPDLEALDSVLVLGEGMREGPVAFFERRVRFIEPWQAQVVEQLQRVAVKDGELRILTFTSLAAEAASRALLIEEGFARLLGPAEH